MHWNKRWPRPPVVDPILKYLIYPHISTDLRTSIIRPRVRFVFILCWYFAVCCQHCSNISKPSDHCTLLPREDHSFIPDVSIKIKCSAGNILQISANLIECCTFALLLEPHFCTFNWVSLCTSTWASLCTSNWASLLHFYLSLTLALLIESNFCTSTWVSLLHFYLSLMVALLLESHSCTSSWVLCVGLSSCSSLP